MRFLCDRMLARLARWLRAAGYDTAMAGESEPDTLLIARAQAGDRLLLTCDRRMLAEREPDDPAQNRIVLLGSSKPQAAAAELSRRLRIDWLAAPFTRCLRDNQPIRPAGAAERRRAPGGVPTHGGAIQACPACGRIYWPGSHVRRMHRQLSLWQRENS